MKILVRPDAASVAASAAAVIADQLARRPSSTLGLATGRTMEPAYAELRARIASGALDASAFTSFNLDEYVGLPASDPRSYRAYMDRLLFDACGDVAGRTHVPDGMQADLAHEAARYEAAIARAGGIDLQLLGLGSNGHIGFNEPGSDFGSRTRPVTLTRETRRQNAAMFGGDPDAVPARALTMGIATILEARRILLVVTGASKAAILAQAIDGPLTTAVTGSVLRTHGDCLAIIDQEAAASLSPSAMQG